MEKQQPEGCGQRLRTQLSAAEDRTGGKDAGKDQQKAHPALFRAALSAPKLRQRFEREFGLQIRFLAELPS